LFQFLNPVQLTKKPAKIFEHRSEAKDQLTILVPVYNQEVVIKENLLSILNNLNMQCRFLIIDDASEDNSVNEILKFAKIAAEKKYNIAIYKNKVPKFETYCDKFLFSKCETEFVIEIQADMKILEKNFDSKMYEAITSNQKIIAISGRGTHDFNSVYENYICSLGTDRAYEKTFFSYLTSRFKYQLHKFYKSIIKIKDFAIEKNNNSNYFGFYHPSSEDFLISGNVGRLGNLIEMLPTEESLNCRKIWCGETIMRGPIIFDLSKYKLVGGLNDSIFFQGFDDHELFLKSNIEFGFRVGYVPIGFSSPIALGSSRRPRSIKNEIIIMLKIVKRFKKIPKSYLFNFPKLEAKMIKTREILDF